MRRNHRNRRSAEPSKHVVVAFDAVDTLRLHALGVKFPETLLIEADKEGGDPELGCYQRSSGCNVSRLTVHPTFIIHPVLLTGNPLQFFCSVLYILVASDSPNLAKLYTG
jgi:hypothetical protein